MSGSGIRVLTAAQSMEVAAKYLSTLQIGKGSVDRLHTLPFEHLLAAQMRFEAADRLKGEAPRAFAPSIDGVAIPRHPFDPDAPAISSQVPMIISTTLDERAYRQINFDLDDAGLLRFAQTRVGDDAARLVAMYRDEDPRATPFVLQARDRYGHDVPSHRPAAGGSQGRRARQRQQRAGVDIFVEDAEPGLRRPLWRAAWRRYRTESARHSHGAERAERAPALRLADQLASAWVSFAATGDPANAKTPQWPAYSATRRTTLVFDGEASGTRAQEDPRRAFREYWAGRLEGMR